MSDNGENIGNNAAFVLEEDDRIHSILVTDGVKHASAPDHETVLTFFAIRRANGLFDIVNIMKTFKGKEVTLRNVQSKEGITEDKIEAEVNALISVFGGAIEAASGVKLEWHRLNLGNVKSRKQQVKLIKDWDRVGVWAE